MKDWLDKIAEEMAGAGDEPPKGFLTTEQIQKKLQYRSHSGAHRWIRRAIKAGKMQQVKVRRPNKLGVVNIIPYYGPK